MHTLPPPRTPTTQHRTPFPRLLALAALLLTGLSARAAAPEKPNILLIMIDTLRADHVSCYGYPKPTTPNLDRLASEGVRFDTVYTAAPWTMPSTMSFLSSLYPTVHGATSYERRASLRVPTLAKRLKRLGYARTAAFTSNPTVNARFGFANGFDLYDDYTIALTYELGLFDADPAARAKSLVDSVTAPAVTRAADEWLTKNGRAQAPWFLFLLYFDPHFAYVPPPPWHRKFDPHPDAPSRKRPISPFDLLKKDSTPDDLEHVVALYDGEVGHTDACIGRLVDRLDALGLRDDTLVVVISDHGEEFLDHGNILHGNTLHGELTRAILIFRQPGSKLPAGRIVTAPATHIDLVPTLLDYIGAPPDPECQGKTRLPALLAASPPPAPPSGTVPPGPTSPTRPTGPTPALALDKEEPFFLEGTTPRESFRAVILGPWKLIRDLESASEQLYHLPSDAAERKNLAAQHPDLCARLRTLLYAHVADCARLAKLYQPAGEAARPTLSPKDLQALKALGYIR